MSAGPREVFLSRALLLAGLAFPFWHYLAPDEAIDWWPLWWLVGLLMMLPWVLARLFPSTRPRTQRLCYAALFALTLQFVWLASVNAMHPFYAVGSVATALNCAVALSSLRAFHVFAASVSLLAAASFLWEPHPLKIAYWGSMCVMLVFVRGQLSARLFAAALLRDQQWELERLVDEKTGDLLERTHDLAATNTRLLREVEEREKAEAKLRDWQKLEALYRLAGGVAHDFNNLLTAISGFAELLRDRLPADSSEREDTEEICRAAERACDLTRSLLAFNRGQTFELTTLDLNVELAGARRMLDLVVGESVEIVMDLEPDRLPIRTNKGELDQLFLNFAANARDAMPRGGVLTYATCLVRRGTEGPEGKQGTSALLSISDTGIGMDEETMRRIFDPFFTTKDVGRGTGLGLAAVHGFITQTDGSIQVSSEPDVGSVFQIEWPCAEAEDAVDPPEAPAPRRGARGSRILVVDDEPSLLKVIARVLGDAGYSVRTTSDPHVALRTLRDGGDAIDLLLTDVVMPRISGLDLARQASSLRPSLPIVFMTGHFTHPSQPVRELPVRGSLLSKPFPPSVLLDCVASALGPARSPWP